MTILEPIESRLVSLIIGLVATRGATGTEWRRGETLGGISGMGTGAGTDRRGALFQRRNTLIEGLVDVLFAHLRLLYLVLKIL